MADLKLWHQHAFIGFWAARVLTTASSQMLMVALGWRMYELTGSAWDLGLIGLVQFVPALLLTLPAGQAADRWHRARIVAACVGLQALAALVLLFAARTQTESRDLLLLLAACVGAARGFQMPAQQALVPMLVPPQLLTRAMAVNASAGQLAILCGPAIAGVLLLGGAAAVYLACLLLHGVAFALLARIRLPRLERTREPLRLPDLLAGVRFVFGHKVLLGALSLDLFAVLLGGAVALMPIFARDVLQVGPAGLGLLRSAPAVGALAMATLLARVPLERRIGPRMLVAVAVYAFAMGVFGLSTELWLSLAALTAAGAAEMVSVVVRHTLVQSETPDAMRGRVGAVNAVFMGASNQLGEFESGATTALMGPVGSVVFGSAATLCVVVAWLRLFPGLARADRFRPPG